MNNKNKRRPLTANRITAAAVALADEQGLDSLSMRRVAQSLGVEAMSLYNHVRNKDALLDAMVEHVAAEIPPPDINGQWRDQMERRAWAMQRALMAHPWASPLFLGRVNVGPAMLGHFDATIGCLVTSGFSYPMADHIRIVLDAYIHGFSIHELAFPFRPETYQAEAKAYLPMIPRDRMPYMYGLAVEVAEGRFDGRSDFNIGLKALLDGLEKLAGQ